MGSRTGWTGVDHGDELVSGDLGYEEPRSTSGGWHRGSKALDQVFELPIMLEVSLHLVLERD